MKNHSEELQPLEAFSKALENKIKEFTNSTKDWLTTNLLKAYGDEAEKWLFHLIERNVKNVGNSYRDLKSISLRFSPILNFQDARLIGLHFRGIGTIEGRRSCILMRKSCYPQKCKEEYFLIFDKLFLRSYFQLFLRRNTLNEIWISANIEKKDKAIQPLLVDFGGKNKRELITVEGNNIAIPEYVSNNLLTEDLFNRYTREVLEKVAHLQDILGSGNQNIEAFSLEIATKLCKNDFQVELEARQTILVSDIMKDKKLSNQLKNLLFPLEKISRNKIDQIITGLQAMMFYCRLTNSRYFYSFPCIKDVGDGQLESISMAIMTTNPLSQIDIENTIQAEERIGAPIFHGRNILKNAIEKRVKDKAEEGDKKQPGFGKQAKTVIERLKSVKEIMLKHSYFPTVLASLCELGSKLKNKKHEGIELQYNFILAPVSTLGSNFKILHSFGEDLITKLDLLEKFPNAKSIINGNFAFLQRDDIALFAPYPSGELSFTHLVQLQGLDDDSSATFDIRQKYLESASQDAGTFIVATFKEGVAALYNKGKMIANTDKHTPEWKEFQSDKYDVFFENLRTKIKNHCDQQLNTNVIDKICLVIRAISNTPNKGASFVLCDLEKIRRSPNARHMTEVFDLIEGRSIEKVSKQQLYELAVQDGATIIDKKSMEISGRWQLPTYNPENFIVNKKPISEILGPDIQQKSLEWGSRHLSALACTFGDLVNEKNNNEAFGALVICVSADGPVAVFEKGQFEKSLIWS